MEWDGYQRFRRARKLNNHPLDIRCHRSTRHSAAIIRTIYNLMIRLAESQASSCRPSFQSGEGKNDGIVFEGDGED
jgi:hypothetical protein